MPGWRDVAVSLLLLVAGQLEVWGLGAAGGSWPAALTTAAAALVLLARRVAPIRTAAGVFAAQAVCGLWSTPDALTFGAASILAWYSVGRWANPRHALVALAASCVVGAGIVSPQGSAQSWFNLYLSVTLTGFVAPWLVGFLVRTRHDSAERRGVRDGLETSAAAPGENTPLVAAPDLSRLSPRETEVFHLLARGATNSEIAQELVLSVYTVKAHVASILAKLGLRDRVQVVVYAHAPQGESPPGARPGGPA